MGYDMASVSEEESCQNDIATAEEIYDIIKDIKDPEKPQTLEELEVVYESGIKVYNHDDIYHVQIEFKPTVSHCSLATLIGLCLRMKLEKFWNKRFKLDIHLKEGTHDIEHEVNKQINDKERIAAAMENPNLQDMVFKCINEEN